MDFKIKYEIMKNYLPINTKRRPGAVMKEVRFITLHDTGNKGSTAKQNVQYFKNSANEMSASAHLFVDDKEIIECIPAFEDPEVAWHVWKSKLGDNRIYDGDANDISIGVEYCYGDNIDSNEAYNRYVWVVAYLCYYHGLNPITDIIGHMVLDPERRSDPKSGLSQSGRSYRQLILDVIHEYYSCIGESVNPYTNLADQPPKGEEKEYPLLKYGMTGEDVKKLQEKLVKLGYDTRGIDGIFGPGTKSAVTRFQKDHDLLIDGIAGKQVFTKLEELLGN